MWDFNDEPTGKWILFQDGRIVTGPVEDTEHHEILAESGRSLSDVRSLGYLYESGNVKESMGFPALDPNEAIKVRETAQEPHRGYSSQKVGPRLRNEFLAAQGLRIAQADKLEWEPGFNGKGWIHPDGSVETWKVDIGGRMGEPHHEDKMPQGTNDEGYWAEGARPFYIRPDGTTVGVFPLDEENQQRLILVGLQPTDEYFFTYDAEAGTWGYAPQVAEDEWRFASSVPTVEWVDDNGPVDPQPYDSTGQGHSWWYLPQQNRVVIGTPELHHYDISTQAFDYNEPKKAGWTHPDGQALVFEDGYYWKREEKEAVEKALGLPEKPFEGQWSF